MAREGCHFTRPRSSPPRLADNSAILLILGGDSLMVGADAQTDIANVPADYLVDDPKVQYLYGMSGSYSFHAMSCPFYNNYPLQYGYYTYSVEMKCAKSLSDYYGGATVYLVKYGQGGATVAQNSITPYNYTLLKEQCLFAIDYITNTLGKILNAPVGFFSFGTNDGNQDIAYANAFQANMNTFYANLKSDLSLPYLKIGVSRINTNSLAIHKDVIWTQLDAFVAEDSTNRFLINTDLCTMYSDSIHFTGEGYDTEAVDLFNKIKTYYNA